MAGLPRSHLAGKPSPARERINSGVLSLRTYFPMAIRSTSESNGKRDINPVDQYENLLDDTFTDATSQQKGWTDFVRAHSNITAYFHGHVTDQFYDWTGPNHTVALHAFRVDSPMKGKLSYPDESKLSFQIATIDPQAAQ